MQNEIKYNDDNVIVRDSDIQGRGIFAATEIKKDDLVMIISGEVIDGDECERREEEEDNVYIFWNGDYYIDTAKTDKIKYINHSCDPTCYVDDRDEHTLNLFAARDIKIGEELTIDYGYEEIYEICTCSSCGEKTYKSIRKEVPPSKSI